MIHNEFKSYAKLCKEQRNVLFEYDKEVEKAREEYKIMNSKERLIELNKSIEKSKEMIQVFKQLNDYKVAETWEQWLWEQTYVRDNLIKELEIQNNQEENTMDNPRQGDFNPILSKEYLGYQYEIYLDAERECLSGEILGLNGWYDSDSLTHLKEQIERRIELETNYQYQNELVEENNKLKAEIEELK